MSSIETQGGPSSESEPVDPARSILAAPPAETDLGSLWRRVAGIRTSAIVIGLVVIAMALRLWELGDRVMHHDESLDAWWSWRFRDGTYNGYDPVYHGPLRFYITALLYELFGASDASARLFSALTGGAAVGLVWYLRHELGRVGTIVAAGALCISPTMLYYSRFGREDAQMVFLALLGLVLGLSYLRWPRVATAAGLAFSLACSFAIKESTYLFAMLLVVYLAVVIAAEFDAAERRDRGHPIQGRFHPGFFVSLMAIITVGLIIAVTVGHRSGQLFTMLQLYFVALAGLVVAAALPQLRRARLTWAPARIALGGVGAAAIAGLFRVYTAEPGELDAALSPVAIVVAIVAIGAAVALWVSDSPATRVTDRHSWALALGLGGSALIALGWIRREAVNAASERLAAEQAAAEAGELVVWPVSIVAFLVGAVLVGLAAYSRADDIGRYLGLGGGDATEDDASGAGESSASGAGGAGESSAIGALLPKPLAIALGLGGLALILNEYTESESSRVGAALVIAVVISGAWAIGQAWPRARNIDFEWPETMRAFGAIGWSGWGITAVAFVVPWWFFFTVFGQYKGDWASGFTKAISYWDSQQEVNRGGEPWYYYLYSLPAYEWLFVLLAALATWHILRRPTLASGLFVWFAVGSVILYSYAGERMPWLIAHPLLPILVLAGYGAAQLWRRRRHRWAVPVAVFLVVAALSTVSVSLRASFSTPTDARELLSQAAQATPHVKAALQRYENIDRLSRQRDGEPARLAIATSEGWPYSWYLLTDPNVTWYEEESGPPADQVFDLIIGKVGVLDPAGFPDHEATQFAMRSWWIVDYTHANPLEWLAWNRNLTLWEKDPVPHYTPADAPLPTFEPMNEPDAEGPGGLQAIMDGADATADSWVKTMSAKGDPINAPYFDDIEPPDGRDGCGSVDQWFLVHRDFAEAERQAFPDSIAAMGPLACANDTFAN